MDLYWFSIGRSDLSDRLMPACCLWQLS